MNSLYLPFSITDYTNSPVLSAVTSPIGTLNFQFSLPNQYSNSISNTLATWYMGDGTVLTGLSAVHSYQYPGTYTISLFVYNSAGDVILSTYQPTINVYNLVPDQIAMDSLDAPLRIYNIRAGQISPPVTVKRLNSWQSLTPMGSSYTINLYCSGSNSNYLDEQRYDADGWAHLNTYFEFLSSDMLTPVNAISCNADPIYAYISNNTIQFTPFSSSNTVLVGSSGTATFYFSDEMAKNYVSEPPSILFASLDMTNFPDKTEQYLNYTGNSPFGTLNTKTVQQFIKTRFNPASQISITSNGIDGEGYVDTSFYINPIKWATQPISFVCKLKDYQWFSTKSYSMLTAFGSGNFNLQLDLVQINSNGAFSRIPNVNWNNADFIPELSANPSTGGYYAGYFSCSGSNLNVALTAGTIITNPFYYPQDNDYAFFFQPETSNLYRYNRNISFSNCTGQLITNFNPSNTSFTVPLSSSFSISVNPNQESSFVCDQEFDKIYKIDYNGNVIYTVALSSARFYGSDGNVYLNDLRVNNSASPAQAAIDSNGDAWICLYDGLSAIKIENSTGIIKSFAYPAQYLNTNYNLSSFNVLTPLSGFYGENTVSPVSIDTDLNNNIWISYFHPLSSFIAKFNTTGQYLTSYNFPTGYSSQELIVDVNNNVWVSVWNDSFHPSNISQRNDYIYKFDSNAYVVNGYPLSGFQQPNSICLDAHQNLFVSHYIQTVTKINSKQVLTNYYMGSSYTTSFFEQQISTIGADTNDFIWVINDYDSQIYFLNVKSTPTGIANIPRVALPPQYYSYSSYGDWLGTRYISKYLTATPTAYVSGMSNIFNIYPVSGYNYITKVNENFDMTVQYQSTIYMESLLSKPILLNDFLGQIVGDVDSSPNTFGKRVYEKIANYSENVSDIDTCNIQALLSMDQMLGASSLLDFNFSYPSNIQRVVDLLSIKQSDLWGDINNYSDNFKQNDWGLAYNSSNLLPISSTVLVVSGYIVAYEKYSKLYRKVSCATPYISSIANLDINSGNYIFPLSSFQNTWGWGLVLPDYVSPNNLHYYYEFYQYVPQIAGGFVQNIINWDDPLTTLSPYNSSNEAWVMDNGIMDQLINFELSNGLGLINSDN